MATQTHSLLTGPELHDPLGSIRVGYLALPVNTNAAYEIQDGSSNVVLQINTTTGAPAIILGNATTNPYLMHAGSGGLILGTGGASAYTLYIGAGVSTTTTPPNGIIQATSITTAISNTTGGTLRIRDGAGTGNHPSGSIIFETAPAGLSGTSPNAYTAQMTISGAGQATFAKSPSAPGSGTTSEQFGLGASASGNTSVAFGHNANASATNGIALGDSATAAHTAAIVLGAGATSTGANQGILGGPSAAISTLIIGNGDTNSSPAQVTIRGTDATGTDIFGNSIIIQPGRSTGAGTSGNFQVSAAAAGSTGSSNNTAFERFQINGDKGWIRVNSQGNAQCFGYQMTGQAISTDAITTQTIMTIDVTPFVTTGGGFAEVWVDAVEQTTLHTAIRHHWVRWSISSSTLTVVTDHEDVSDSDAALSTVSVTVTASGGSLRVQVNGIAGQTVKYAGWMRFTAHS